MRSACIAMLGALILSPMVCSWAAPATFELVETVQVTHAMGRAQTTRSTGRCLCTDGEGNAHMAWEDARHLSEFEIYYTSTSGDTVLPEVRITRSPGESSYPAIACDSGDVYIVWEEVMGKDSEIFCVHLRNREEVGRVRVTDTNLDSSCPACAAGPDGAVHVAWHEGPYKQTAVHYAKIVDDSVVASEPMRTKDPEAFRPDIACDSQGRVLMVWFEGLEVASCLWDGESWGKPQVVGVTKSRPWRLSVTALRDGNWAAAWFHRGEAGEEVFVKLFDGTKWYDQVKVSGDQPAFYPNVAALDDGGLVTVWEEHLRPADIRTLVIRSSDGRDWGPPMEIYRHHVSGRYASLAAHEDMLHAVWFSAKSGASEIYYARFRAK